MLPVALTLLAIGLALSAHGLIGRRVGDEPRCRKCKYNLTGVEAGKCPECGRPWTPATAARGLRHRRKRPLAIGATILLISAGLSTAIITGRLRKTNWFTHLPTPWIVPFAARGNIDAFTTLADRFDNDKLTPSQINDLAEAGLTLQADPQLEPTTQDWIDLLARLEAKSKLTPAQRERFFQQMVHVEIRMRARVRDRHLFAAYVPVLFERRIRMPSRNAYMWYARIEAITSDGKVIDVAAIFDRVRQPNLAHLRFGLVQGPLEYELPCSGLKPGKHAVEFRLQTSISSIYSRNAVWSGNQTLKGEFEFTPNSATEPVRIVSDEAIVTQLRDALKCSATLHGLPGGRQSIVVRVRINRPSPCDALLDVVCESRSLSRGEIDWDQDQLRLHENASTESLELGGFDMANRLNPGDHLTVKLRTRAIDSKSVLGFTRLKAGIDLAPFDVRIQPAPNWTPTTQIAAPIRRIPITPSPTKPSTTASESEQRP